MATIDTVSAQIERLENEYRHASRMLTQAATDRARKRHVRRMRAATSRMDRLQFDLMRWGAEPS